MSNSKRMYFDRKTGTYMSAEDHTAMLERLKAWDGNRDKSGKDHAVTTRITYAKTGAEVDW